MSGYYFSIIFINIAVLLILCVMTFYNTTLNKRQKNGFTMIFISIAIVIIVEAITVVLDGRDVRFRMFHILANIIGFAVSPIIPVLCGGVISSFKRTKYIYLIYFFYELIIIFTIQNNFIFKVDGSNIYHRGRFYWIYIVAYLLGVLYLFIETYLLTISYQIKNYLLLYLVFILILTGTSIQVIEPTIRTTWLCVTFASVIYYTYCNELWHQVDGLTKLLNQHTYLLRVKKIQKESAILIFDVDNFKTINDTYGHQFGDVCLQRIAKCIKRVYGKYGLCYRIGGDEFCVILNNHLEHIDSLNDELTCMLDEQKIKEEKLLSVSIGYAKYSKNDNIINVIEEADRSMYMIKQCRKDSPR